MPCGRQCAAQGSTGQGEEVRHHFVCLLPAPSGPGVVELDGMKPGPVLHSAPSCGGGFLEQAAGVLRERFVARFADPEGTHMAVLALVGGEGGPANADTGQGGGQLG